MRGPLVDLQLEFARLRSGVTFYTLVYTLVGCGDSRSVRAKLGFESSQCVAAGGSINDASMFIVVACWATRVRLLCFRFALRQAAAQSARNEAERNKT